MLTVCFLFFSTCYNSQNRKKPIPAKESNSFIISLLGKNIEDGTLEINGKLAPLGINFTKVEEEKDFIYDHDLHKTETVYSYYKTLFTNNGLTLKITANSDRKIIETSLDFSDTVNVLRKKCELIFGKPSLLLYSDTGTKIYKQKGSIYMSTNLAIRSFTSVDEVLSKSDSLKYGSTLEEMGYNFNKILTENNNPVLFAERKSVNNDTKYNFNSYIQRIYYKNGFVLTLSEDHKKNIFAKILNSNAIYMSNLSNKIISDGYSELYGTGSNYYKKGEIFMTKNDDYMFIYIVPKESAKRLIYADVPNTAFLDYYYSMFDDFAKRDLFLEDHFVKKENFYSRENENGEVINLSFGYQKDFQDNRGFKFLIDTGNKSVNNFFENNVPENLTYDAYNMNDKNFPNRTQFYDKAIYSAALASTKAQQYAKNIAQQKQDAADKQMQILNEEEKARKAVENAALIKTATNSLLNSLNSIINK